MTPVLPSWFAGALLAAPLCLAWAAPPADQAQQVQIHGRALPLPDAATLRAMTGEFALSDGRALRVIRPGLHLMAGVGRHWAVQIEPIGPNRFATPDRRLVVEFLSDAQGQVDQLRLIENDSVTVAARQPD